MGKISIIVVDDHPLFRQGVVDALSLEHDFSIVGQAADGKTGLSLIQRLVPDVAVIDVNMPGINGQRLTSLVVGEVKNTRVVLLTGYDDVEQHLQAARAGASAYCTKDMEPEELVRVIKRVAQGDTMGEAYREEDESLDETCGYSLSEEVDPSQPLSAREMEVLVQLTRGQSNKEIAVTLGISHQTVKNHVTAVLRKLGVEDRTQAAVYALRRGWVRLRENENAE
jgi:two-component system, NarL family, response regulator DegU